MDKNSMLANPLGYSIQFGTASYETTLDERIEAAKIASSISKQKQRQNISGKLYLTNKSAPLEKDANFQNMTIKKPTNIAQEYKRKSKCLESVSETHFEPTNYVFSSNPTVSKNTNLHDFNNLSSSFKPNNKGGGLMQRRLEALKKKNTLLVTDNALESTKLSTNSSRQISFEDTKRKIPNYNQISASFSHRNEYKTRSAVQKNLNYERNTLFGFGERSINTTNSSNYCLENPESSVQNRLIKAKEEIKAKSKFLKQNDVTKTEIIQRPPQSTYALNSNHQDSNSLVHNCKNKTKRLNQSGLSNKKNIQSFVSTSKKIISNNSDINKIIDQQLVVVQKKPAIPNKTNVSTSMQSQGILNKSQQKELDSFSFNIPETSSVQQRLKKKKKVQFNNDDSMEWEDVEPENIVNKVNDFRKSELEYEPMEWTPDSIMHCDKINLCFVIDTNILLSNLKSITMIINKTIPDYGYPTIMLPWQVLQELDCLKKKENALGYRAREATRWLLNTFSQCHPRVKGQPMLPKSSKNPDDTILECALSVKERVNFVCLVTNDKMLSIKSEINGITAKNSVWLQNVLVPHKEHSSPFQDAIAKYPFIENQLIMNCIPRLEHTVSRVLKFSIYFNQQLPLYLKKTWWKIYSLKPPLDLTKCLFALKDNWNIITFQQTSKPPQKQIEWLANFFDDLKKTAWQTSLSWSEIYNLFKYCSEIINYLPYEYYDITDSLLNDLMVARKILKRKMDSFSTTLDDESLLADLSNNLSVSNTNNNNNNASTIDSTFLNILKIVETFCSDVYEASGIEHNLPKDELNRLYLKNMYSKQKVYDFCSKLSNLIKYMSKIQIMSTEEILNSCIVIDAFSKTIVEFGIDCTELDREKLTDYCLMKDKNLFLSVLVSFQNNLSKIKNLVTALKF